jgi:hypothetical protein
MIAGAGYSMVPATRIRVREDRLGSNCEELRVRNSSPHRPSDQTLFCMCEKFRRRGLQKDDEDLRRIKIRTKTRSDTSSAQSNSTCQIWGFNHIENMPYYRKDPSTGPHDRAT